MFWRRQNSSRDAQISIVCITDNSSSSISVSSVLSVVISVLWLSAAAERPGWTTGAPISFTLLIFPENSPMTAAEIVKELKPLGSESIKKVLLKHGIQEPLLGVKVDELKKIQKRIKKDYQLALDLYDTGIYDAMYLAGLIADDRKMTKKDLQHWVDQATCPALCGFTVAWVAASSFTTSEQPDVTKTTGCLTC